MFFLILEDSLRRYERMFDAVIINFNAKTKPMVVQEIGCVLT